jgi:tetratricopeptide (TPR) repeat protein
MFASRNFSPARPTPFSRRTSILLIGFLAWTIRDGLCAPAPAPCTKPSAIASRLRAHPDAQTWTELGNWFGDRKQFACAQQAFRSGLRLDPHSAQISYLLGLSLYESQDFKDAVAPLQHSIHTDPTVLKPHLLLASIFTRLTEPEEAEPEWRAALGIDPTSSMALHGLSQALLARQNFADEIALLHNAKLDEDLAIDLAVAYARDGQLADAVSAIANTMESFPNSVKLSNALVALYVKVSRTLDAEHLAQKTYQAHPEDVSAQTSYLRTLVINGDWGPAKPVGDKLLAEAPHAYDTLYLNGVMERQAGDFAAARDHLTEALAIHPGQQSVEANLGIALSRLHDPADAKIHLEKALELGNTEPETHFELASALRALGQTDEAKQEMLRYQQAVKDRDNTTLAVSKAAEAAQALAKGDTQHAVDLYKEAFAAAPQNALIGYRLATALDQAGDTDGEQSVLEKVVAIDPSIALAQNQLGYLESRRGDYTSAESHFRQAVASAPAFTQAWISLAATLGMESKFSEAEQAVASALRLDPQNSEAQQLRHDLAAAQSQQPHN